MITIDSKARELIKQHNACFPTAKAQAYDLSTEYQKQGSFENAGFWAAVAYRIEELSLSY